MKNTLLFKHSGTFANGKYEELSYPKNPKMCDPIPVTVLKMQSHYSQSSSENETPSSGTSPLPSKGSTPQERKPLLNSIMHAPIFGGSYLLLLPPPFLMPSKKHDNNKLFLFSTLILRPALKSNLKKL